MKICIEKNPELFEMFDGEDDDPIFYINENTDKLTLEEVKKLLHDFHSKN